MHKPRPLLVVSLLLVLALALAGCGDKKSSQDETVSTGTPVPGSRLVIATTTVDAPLSTSVVPATGVMPSPVDDEVYLYDWSQLQGFGGVPGEGNTVIGGRRNTVFKDIESVTLGSPLDLTWKGQTHLYTVTSVCFWDSRRGKFEDVVATTPDETVTVITSFGPKKNVELGRLVLTAKRRDVFVAKSDCPGDLQPLSSIDFEPAQ